MKEKEEKDVCVLKTKPKTEERELMFQTKVENGATCKSDQ